eukprot:sb/3469494/
MNYSHIKFGAFTKNKNSQTLRIKLSLISISDKIQEVNAQTANKHHLGDFLPKEELERFYQKVSAAKKGTKAPSIPTEAAIGEDNVGYKMLQKAGWKEGSGLGATGSGIVAPIDSYVKRWGTSKEWDKRYLWKSRTFSSFDHKIQEVNAQTANKHHLGDFLPKEELERFYQKVSAAKKGTKAPSIPTEAAIGEDNVGYKMLQKAGWKEGSGLGATGSGIVAPIDSYVKR